MIKYYEVLSNKISYLIYSDLAHYIHLKKGDIVKKINITTVVSYYDESYITIDGVTYYNNCFVLNWNKITIQLTSLENKNHFIEVTNRELRNKKINEIINHENSSI
jgi:hypothetical protein